MQAVPLAFLVSLGQAEDEPVHFSSESHSPAAARQVVADERFVHVPTEPLTLHAWQSVVEPPPHAPLQHTPSTQLPLWHCVPVLHETPFAFSARQIPPSQ